MSAQLLKQVKYYKVQKKYSDVFAVILFKQLKKYEVQKEFPHLSANAKYTKDFLSLCKYQVQKRIPHLCAPMAFQILEKFNHCGCHCGWQPLYNSTYHLQPLI